MVDESSKNHYDESYRGAEKEFSELDRNNFVNGVKIYLSSLFGRLDCGHGCVRVLTLTCNPFPVLVSK